MTYDCHDLIRLFADCFASEFNTRLVGGAPEPVYLPADANEPMHRIIFTLDYYRSALHELHASL
ncbi:elongation factor P hydroxylase [Pseudomonas sp. FME51]|uniref:elongation factor P hydroxylase n=1 Tax=Pseudomonas sp. FME51 TaxID=2742609 RepID=UPI001865D634|nr:elongation factor P hydroxylase [Pseudomonas sp. FME51]